MFVHSKLVCVYSYSLCTRVHLCAMYISVFSVCKVHACPRLCKYPAYVCVSGVWVGVCSHSCVFVIHRGMQC